MYKTIKIDMDSKYNDKYNDKLNCLPNNVKKIILPYYYDKKFNKLPSNLKTMKCSKEYQYINDFKNYNVIFL